MRILHYNTFVYTLVGNENKNRDQQTEALESYFAIDLEMYRNWQKMEISKISIAYTCSLRSAAPFAGEIKILRIIIRCSRTLRNIIGVMSHSRSTS